MNLSRCDEDMIKKDFIDLLRQQHTKSLIESPRLTISEFLSNQIFFFTTSRPDDEKEFVGLAVDAIDIITNDDDDAQKLKQKIFSDESRRKWHIAILNMPFFFNRITYGISINHPFWDVDKNPEKSVMLLWNMTDHPEYWRIDKHGLSAAEWDEFMRAVVEFYRGYNEKG